MSVHFWQDSECASLFLSHPSSVENSQCVKKNILFISFKLTIKRIFSPEDECIMSAQEYDQLSSLRLYPKLSFHTQCSCIMADMHSFVCVIRKIALNKF